MKIALTFVLISLNFVTDRGCKRDSDLIFWSKERILTWEDFKGSYSYKDTFSVGSSIKLQLKYRLTDKSNKLKVFCVFSKDESWYFDTSTYALNHEMGHFNIGEIVARMLRKKLLEYKDKGILLDQYNVDALFKQYTKILFEKQLQYDSQTNHSLIENQQADWNAKIKNELEDLRLHQNANKTIVIGK
jgi:hypothetical protein